MLLTLVNKLMAMLTRLATPDRPKQGAPHKIIELKAAHLSILADGFC